MARVAKVVRRSLVVLRMATGLRAGCWSSASRSDPASPVEDPPAESNHRDTRHVFQRVCGSTEMPAWVELSIKVFWLVGCLTVWLMCLVGFTSIVSSNYGLSSTKHELLVQVHTNILTLATRYNSLPRY